MIKRISVVLILWLLISPFAGAAPVNTLVATPASKISTDFSQALNKNAPASINPATETPLSFATLIPDSKSLALTGINPETTVEFSVRKDQIVSTAQINLIFTPSPALIPVQSQLKIYLNDELIYVVPILETQLGKSNLLQIPFQPRFISDFNRLRFSFVGHYQAICENPANTSLWLDISKLSNLQLTFQTLPVSNDLSIFPQPFIDPLDKQPLVLPMVFSGSPSMTQQQAAAILASWFGSQVKWRGQNFPVLYNTLSDKNLVVFATNEQRPSFLAGFPQVKAPTIALINHPKNPYAKALLIMGRNDADLVTAVKGIAQGHLLFRGSELTVDKVEITKPRRPYDAPNWIATDRPVKFSELIDYKDQLQTRGMTPWPVAIYFQLPPDLYLDRSGGVHVDLKYRYSQPPPVGTSRLNVSMNNHFVESFKLSPNHNNEFTDHLPIISGLFNAGNKLIIPATELGTHNDLRFNFEFMTAIVGGTTAGQCETYTLVGNQASIDGSSTIDFSDYYHFMSMPNLAAFVSAGFPFSRLADLSETVVLQPKNADPTQVSTLLNVMGNIGAQTGFSALGLRVTDEWSTAKKLDADILMLGPIPDALQSNDDLNLLTENARSWIKAPFANRVQNFGEKSSKARQVQSKTTVTSTGTLAGIIGLQSPYFSQRSIVGLLANDPKGFALINRSLINKNQLSQINGSVAVIRDSGINSLHVGPVYHVGHMPWWVQIWYALQSHPGWLVIIVSLVTLLFAMMLWYGFKAISYRRLSTGSNS